MHSIEETAILNSSTSQFVLSNGLRCVHIADSSVAEMAGVFINAGSADDPADRHGLAHFVEHTVFKGTKRRSSWHINNRMEAVGGELNAYTSKEETFIYAVGPQGCTERAIELIADLVADATFQTREIDIERGVIADEIDTYLDSPSDAAYDDFEDMLFAGTPLGHNILGSRESIAAITGDDCRRFVEMNYTADNMVAFYIGAASRARVEQLCERHFGQITRLKPTPPPVSVPEPGLFNAARKIDSHQANTVGGSLTAGRCSPHRTALLLLANITGGTGMNALLNLELREKRGLVYSVESSTSFYRDTGMFTVSYGCDPHNEQRCRRVASTLLQSRLERFLTPRRIEAAKKQFIGQTVMRYDYRDTRAFNAARSLFFDGDACSLPRFIENVKSIDAETLRTVAESTFSPERFCWLTLQ